ncbi:hypothetical protein [Sphingomonas sp. S2-65]|uniref:hypothetical protein n=1 Tax=Sphingomonas sp. S2-65 TaxID=2903960 RepID=UPI001F2BE1C4|nr:hypothetical protein [Sphingomonas sp. S2-65]UYY59702.1 hypothetical protein LZ586_06350 [Sphingomonas sp. S2-65]
MRNGTLAALALTAAVMPLPGGGDAQASGGGSGGGEGLNLVTMEQVVVPIIDADRVTGALKFKLVLEAATAEAAAEATAELPMLRQATVAAGLEFARLNASGLRAVDAEELDHDLTAALKAAEPGIARVLIVEVSASQG